MGTLTFQAALGGSVNLLGPNTASTVNLTLPSADGTSGQALQTNGSGTLSFATLGIGGGGTGATSFTANQIHYGSFSQSAGLTFDGTNFATTGTATAAKLIPTGSSATGNGLYLPATNALGLSTNGTNAVYIDSSQNVGIGTTLPSTYGKLAVYGTNAGGDVSANVINYSTAASTTTSLILNDTGGDLVKLMGDNAGATASLRAVNRNNQLSFWTGSAGGAERMRIDSSGNVGIGVTPSGTFRLQIEASSGLVSVASSTGTNASNIRTTNTGGSLICGIDNSVGTVTGTAYATYVNNTANTPLTFQTNTTERMRISSTGIVTMSAYGVGTATFSAAGVISSVSDETWKIKDGVPVDPDSMLKKLEPGYWYYNDEKKEIFGVDRQLGFYAQNVNAAIGPEAAPTPEEGKPWGYYDRSVLAVTVMSLQKALATIESLTARIEALEAK